MDTYPAAPAVRNYDLLAPIYDLLAAIWTGGAIRASRLWCAQRVQPCKRVLILGPGTGEDVAAICAEGLDTTIIDVSRKMLDATLARCRKKASPQPISIHGDFRLQQDLPGQDVILAPYILNVFSTDEVKQIIEHLLETLEPGGRILVSDFSPPPEGFLSRFIMEVWHGIPMLIFHLLGGNAWHGVHRLPELLEDADLEITHRQKFRIFSFGPRWIEALELTRRGGR